MAYHFQNECGGEQSYGEIVNADELELINMIKEAYKKGVELVPIMDAECDVVIITTKRISKLLLPILNDEKLQPLDSLNYREN